MYAYVDERTLILNFNVKKTSKHNIFEPSGIRVGKKWGKIRKEIKLKLEWKPVVNLINSWEPVVEEIFPTFMLQDDL